jgi:hypothetical protein
MFADCGKEYKEAYRFTYISTFGGVFSISAKGVSNHFSISYAAKDGQPVIQNGEFDNIKYGNFPLLRKEWDDLVDRINKDKLINFPILANSPAGDQDGILFEGCFNGKYSVVHVFTPDASGGDDKFIELGMQFIRLSKLNVDIRKILVK